MINILKYIYFLLLSAPVLLFGATYTVSSNADDGSAGTLRWAITQANANAGSDNIEFNIAGSTEGARTIRLTSILPSLQDALVIDATTQPNGAVFGVSDAMISITGTYTYCFQLSNSNIEIYGFYITGGFDYGIRSWSGSSKSDYIIGAANKGNVITDCDDEAIYTWGDQNVTIKGNFIGLDPDGTTISANGEALRLNVEGPGYLNIGGANAGEGNVISGNGSSGIQVYANGTDPNIDITITNNIIGLDYTGTVAKGNDDMGIYIANSSFNFNFYSSATVTGNVVSDNGSYGDDAIRVTEAEDLVITNNYVGSDINGENDFGCTGTGIWIYDINTSADISGNVVIGNDEGINLTSDLIGTVVDNNKVGVDATGNVIVGHDDYGVYLSIDNVDGLTLSNNTISGNGNSSFDDAIYLAANNNVISGNTIGLNAAGTAALGNLGTGIFQHVSYGSNTISNNIVSANGGEGIEVTGDNNILTGNIIGTDATLSIDLGNTRNGIDLRGDDNRIGGSGAGEGNTIAYNDDEAIYVSFATQNLISRNSMFANGNGGGIYLGYLANNWKNAPTVVTADAISIVGTSDANDIIEVFIKDNVAGNCEGMIYIATTTANGSGDWTIAGDYSGCGIHTATATDASNNTSEFSPCLASLNPPTYSGPVSFCSGAITPLAASGDAGATFNWYSDAALTSLVFAGNPYAMPAYGDVWVTQSVGSCESDAIQITITNQTGDPGSSCGNPFIVNTFPFHDTTSTCGSCDAISASDVGCAGDASDMDGEEFIYTYMPTSNITVYAGVYNMGEPGALFAFDGCPTDGGTNCLGFEENSKSSALAYNESIDLLLNLTAGTTYYFIYSEETGCSDFSFFLTEAVPALGCGALVPSDEPSAAPILCNNSAFCNNSGNYDAIDVYSNNIDDIFPGSIGNNGYVAFYAKSTILSVKIDVSNCAQGDGMQAVIVEDLTGAQTTFQIVSSFWSPSGEEDGYVLASGLTVGEKYYFMFDGAFDDACDIEVSAGTGVELDIETRTDTTICTNATIPLIAIGGAADDIITWNNGVSNDTIWVSPNADTTYIVTNTSANGDCDVDDTVNITVNPTPRLTMANQFYICNGSAADISLDLVGSAPFDIVYTDGNGNNNYNLTNINTDPYTVSSSALGVLEITQISDALCVNDTSITTTISSSADDDPTFTYADFCEDASGAANITGLAGGTFTFNPDPADGSSIVAGTGVITNAIGGSTYQVEYLTNGNCPDSLTLNIGIGSLPDPGTDAVEDFCDNEGDQDLFGYLGGTPESGGQWKDNSNVNQADGIINTILGPVLDGAHTYTLSGDSGCASQSATVTVSIEDSAFAGDDNAITLCTGLNVALEDYISNIVAGGTWYNPSDLVVVSGSLATSTGPAGIYYYVVAGTSPCGPDTAFLDVTINIAPDAGTGFAKTVCNSVGLMNLFDSLIGTPDAGGNWDYPHTAGNENGQFLVLTASDGKYLYTVAGPAGCIDDTASIRLTILDSVTAGTDGAVNLCSDSTISLYDYINNEDLGGQWFNPGDSAILANDSIWADTASQGDYYYVVSASIPCINDTSIVTIGISPSPEAGLGLDTIFCSNYGNLDLSTLLTNTNLGGNWDYADGSVNQNGVFNMSTQITGAYEYILTGGVGCKNDTATINLTINPEVEAGTGGTYNLCSDTIIDLFDYVSGEDVGGSWLDPSLAVLGSTNLNTASAVGGTYRYVVSALDSCSNDTAEVIVNISTAVTAGLDLDTSICANNGSTDLNVYLRNETTGGNWNYVHTTGNETGIFNASIVPTGTADYQYIIQGGPGCSADTSRIRLTIESSVNAGTGRSLDICNSTFGVDLSTYLNGTPDGGGNWQNQDFDAMPSAIIDGDTARAGHYYYILTAVNPCVNDTSIIDLTVTVAPDAGLDSALALCDGGAFVDLDTIVNAGTIETWKDPSFVTIPSIIDPQTDAVGQYLHIVIAGPGCIDDTAFVDLTLVNGPDAGLDATYSDCSNAADFDMFPLLGGTPDVGGRWYNDDMSYRGALGNTFDIDVDLAGDFYYVVAAADPCDSAVAKVSISISAETNAGLDSLAYDCRNGDTLNLLQHLGGSPDNNGSWQDPFGAAVAGNTITLGTADSGIYIYTVPANGSCASGSADLRVVINDSAYAGQSVVADYCDTRGTISLTAQLAGDPDSIGDVRWFDPVGASLGSGVKTLDLSNSLEGIYSYVVIGDLGCADDTSELSLNIDSFLFAGDDNSNVYCDFDSMIGLFPLLLNSPDSFGIWKDTSLSNLAIDSINLSIADSGTYYYIHPVNGQCAADTAAISLIINQSSNAGLDSITGLCESIGSLDLEDYRNGTFDDGGVWELANSSVGNNIIINASNFGTTTYMHIVTGALGCPNDTSAITLTVDSMITIGTGNASSECALNIEVDLFDYMGGTYDTSGYWLNDDRDTIANHKLQLDTANGGIYKYIITDNGVCPGDSILVNLTLGAEANAGRDTSTLLCALDSIISMYNQLPGAPENGGRWYDDNAVFYGNWDMTVNANAVDSAAYTYEVSGVNGCADGSAILLLNIHQPALAGNASDLNICEDDSVSLNQQLNGLFGAGVWYNPGDSIVFGDSLRLDTTTEGQYQYIVTGTGICPNDTAQMVLDIGRKGDAGMDDVFVACKLTDNVSIYNQLGGSPDQNGGWYDSANNYFGAWNMTIDPLTTDSGSYFYRVNGEFGCINDESELALELHETIGAGNGIDIALCETDTLALFNQLSGVFDINGAWYNPSDDLILNDTLRCDTGVSATYYYVVVGSGGCGNDTANFSISIADTSNAGTSNAMDLCSSNNSISLFNLIGTHDNTGDWYFRNSVYSSPASFDPETALTGSYFYVIDGQNGCKDDSAQVDINIANVVNAGRDTNVYFCNTDDSLDVLDLIPNGISGGVFNGTLPLGGTSGSVYYPSLVSTDSLFYILAGTNPCPADTATYRINTSIYQSSGADSSMDICSDITAAVLNLNNADIGGVWSYNGDDLGSDIITIADYNPGIHFFVYTMTNDAPCASPFSLLEMNIGENYLQLPEDIPNYNHCQNDGVSNDLMDDVYAFNNLFGIDVNGAFYYQDGTPLVSSILTHEDTAYSDTIHYLAVGQSGCPDVDVAIYYEVYERPNLGLATSSAACYLDSSYSLINFMNGNPDTFGYWLNASNDTILDGTFNPTTLSSAGASENFTYSYTHLYCGGSTKGLTLTFEESDSPGEDSSIFICRSDGAISLVDYLGGTPSQPGFWYNILDQPISSNFNPTTDSGGVFTYQVLNNGNACPPSESDLSIIVLDTPIVFINIDSAIGCHPHRVNFSTADDYPQGTIFKWHFGTGDSSLEANPSGILFEEPGTYTVSLEVSTVACPSNYKDSIQAIQVNQTPIALIAVDTLYKGMDDASFNFTNATIYDDSNLTYIWDFGDETVREDSSLNFIYTYQDTGAYMVNLVAMDSIGCWSNDTISIGITPVYNVFFPTGFTPDGDGLNDGFGVVAHPSAIASYEMKVFSRWGEIIFSSEDINYKWDGTWLNQGSGYELDAGAYYYMVRVVDTLGKIHESITGSVMLLR